MLAGAGFFWRVRVHNLVLSARLEEAAQSRGEIERRNQELIQEIAERKRAEQALTESEKELHYLSSRLIAAQEEERKRIARDLHDSIGQTLAAMKFSLENALHQTHREDPEAADRLLERLIPFIQQAIQEVRSIYTGLRPSILDDFGILSTIGWFCREFQVTYPRHYIEVEIGIEEERVPEELKITIFRIMQEALNNMAKYSRAELVSVSLVERENQFELIIEDNGDGFDVQEVRSSRNPMRGMGLTSMRERAELSGGTFSIKSTRGEGTVIRATWPLPHGDGEAIRAVKR